MDDEKYPGGMAGDSDETFGTAPPSKPNTPGETFDTSPGSSTPGANPPGESPGPGRAANPNVPLLVGGLVAALVILAAFFGLVLR